MGKVRGYEPPSYEYLYKAYFEEEKTLFEIACDLYCSQPTVKRWLDGYGIPIRQGNKGRKKKGVDRDRVFRLLALGRTYEEIAETMNISKLTIKDIVNERNRNEQRNSDGSSDQRP